MSDGWSLEDIAPASLDTCIYPLPDVDEYELGSIIRCAVCGERFVLHVDKPHEPFFTGRHWMRLPRILDMGDDRIERPERTWLYRKMSDGLHEAILAALRAEEYIDLAPGFDDEDYEKLTVSLATAVREWLVRELDPPVDP